MTEPEEGGLDLAYESFLGQVPEALRTQIEPAFKAYNEDIQGKVKQFEPFNEILSQGWTPDHVNVGLNLLQELNTNPQRIFQALADEHPELLQQFAPAPQQTNPGTLSQQTPPVASAGLEDLPPALIERMNQQEELINLLYKGFSENQQQTAAQQQAAQEAQELAQFKQQLDQIAPEDKYPRQFILSYVANGQSPQDAVKSFEAWKTQELSAQRAAGAPLIAPAGGGGLPSEPINTAKLNDEQRKALMVSYMEAARQQQ